MAPRRRPPTTPHQLIRIVIVEPRALVGVGIHEILDREPDMEVVAEVRSADDAIALAEEGAPDVFILDVELREPMTSAATHRLAQEAPDSGMVVVGGEDNDASILDAIEIGAMGHLAAAAEPEELVAVVRKVAEGEDPLRDEVIARPDLVDKILEAFREGFRRVEDPPGPPLEHARAGGPARGRERTGQPGNRGDPGRHRTDGEEPPHQHSPEARRSQPDRGGDGRGAGGLDRP